MSEIQRTSEVIPLPERFKPLLRKLEEHYVHSLDAFRDQRYINGKKDQRLEIRSITEIAIDHRMINATDFFYEEVTKMFCDVLHVPDKICPILLMKENTFPYLMEEIPIEELARLKKIVQHYMKKFSPEEQNIFLNFCQYMQDYYLPHNPMHHTDLYRSIIASLIQFITEIPMIYDMRTENGEESSPVEEIASDVSTQSSNIIKT
jgi:hypothetical protein